MKFSTSRNPAGLVLCLIAATAVALLSVTPAQAAPAAAAAAASDIGWSSSATDGGLTESVALHFASGAPSAAQLAEFRQSLDAASSTSTAGTVTPDAAPKGAYLYCNKAYAFSDSDGKFTTQHACGGKTTPWGFKMASEWCAVAITGITEHGISWTHNGHGGGRGAAHPDYPCDYQFHGTFNPTADYDFLTYTDLYEFTVDIGGEVGAADLTISGSYTVAGCTSGKACGL